MSKALKMLALAKIIEAADFKAGDNVKFKDGHAMAGTLGRVVAVNPDGTIGVKIGQALQPPVEAGQLELVGGDNSSTAPAAPVDGDPAPQA